MAELERNYLAAWREHRGMTQEELGEAAQTTGSVISLLEAGKRGLSPKWLRRLAVPLKTTPGFLLDEHPDNLPTDVLDVWMEIPDGRREEALGMLRAFAAGARG